MRKNRQDVYTVKSNFERVLILNKTKKIVAIIIAAVLVFVEVRYNLIEYTVLQFSPKAYINYVSDSEYSQMLIDNPICVMDKLSHDRELAETDLEKTTERYEMHDKLMEKYKLNEVATAEKDFDKALQILNWLTEHTYYNGAQMGLITDNTLDILEDSFDKPFYGAINCRYKAIAFSDCLVAVGIKAYPVCMQSSGFNNNHFTVRAYINELDKWCMFDPSFGCWFSDNNGSPLDFYEVRELFIADSAPTVNEYSFNGTEEAFDVYVNSFLKHNMSNLSTWEDNSMNRRDKASFSGRKIFDAKLPE